MTTVICTKRFDFLCVSSDAVKEKSCVFFSLFCLLPVRLENLLHTWPFSDGLLLNLLL